MFGTFFVCSSMICEVWLYHHSIFALYLVYVYIVWYICDVN